MKEYNIKIDDDGVQSRHDNLLRLAERCRRASRMDRDDVEVDGPDDEVAEYLAYVLIEETKRKQSR